MFDLVLKNGNIITMDNQLSRKRWVAVKDGLIAATGDRDDFSGEAKTVVDLEGKTVLPGLIDPHIHGSMTGIGMKGIDLQGIDSSQGVLDAVAEFCAKDPVPKVICGCNMNLREGMKDGKLPTRYQLDEVSNGHTVMLVFWTAHGGVMNSKAVERADLGEEFKFVEKDGYFNEDKVSFHVIGNIYNLFSEEEFIQLYKDLGYYCASKGITSVHLLDGMMVKDDRDVDILTGIRNELPIDARIYTQTFNWKKVAAYGLKQVGGCLCIDGSPPQLTAAYQEPYPMAPHTRGFLNYTDKELYEYVLAVTKAGMQVSFHAIGDRAVDQIVHVYQQVDREVGIRELRHRVEHFSLPTEAIIASAAEMNVVGVVQPAIGNNLDRWKDGNAFENFVSKEKAQIHENYTYLINGGVVTCGSSDSPCSPLDPFIGMNACVNSYNPNRRVSLDQALKMYTLNPAWTAHEEDIKGSIECGKQADMVVIDKDPYALTDCIDSSVISVLETYRKGQLIFKK